ncbi:MAG: LLM class flavin-dependent oxidoreductase, partial [Dehalococcoidia bacterium]|nr:LLM class flavin-dependent oxidoreductase [Dehalococcoidia bacterium]
YLSGGRLVIGAGAGWLREEFEAIGAPPFDHRGTVTDEFIAAFRELWRSETPAFSGTYTSFHNIKAAPKPATPGGPPIWIGGESPVALRRAGRTGDGWYPIGSNPTYPLRTPAHMAASIATVKRHAQEAGRDPATLDFGLQAGWLKLGEATPMDDGARLPLTGTAGQITGDIHALEDLGVRHLVVGMVGATVAETNDRLAGFMAAFGG